ncbi:MAG: hypothetical protein GX271_11465 [Clostridiales bacterium]|nr:hypothetical protein [Clostridiales bacterium]
MDVKKKLPSGVLKFLSGYQVKSEDIITYANTDMTLEGEFARGYIILTQHKIIILRSEPDKSEVYQFKGVGSKNELHMGREKNWAAKFVSLKEIENLEVIRSISGGVLYYSAKNEESESGPDIQLAAFTNMMIGAVLHIVKLFGILKGDGELTEEVMKTEEEEEYCPKCGSMYPDKERKICPKCMDKKSVFVRILTYFKPFAPKIILMILCYIVTAALNLVWPYLSGKILYDKVLSKNSEFLESLGIPGINYIIALGLVILIMFLTKITIQILGIIQGVLTATIVPKIVMKMKSQVFQTMGELSISFLIVDRQEA